MKYEYINCSFTGVKAKNGVVVNMNDINDYAKKGYRFIQLHLTDNGYFCIFEKEIK